MKAYRIKRVTANTGIVERLQIDGSYNDATPEIKIKECRAFLIVNQKDLKTYKIAEYNYRKDAKRHLAAVIYAETYEDALAYFCEYDMTHEAKRRELLTGDWKLLSVNM